MLVLTTKQQRSNTQNNKRINAVYDELLLSAIITKKKKISTQTARSVVGSSFFLWRFEPAKVKLN